MYTTKPIIRCFKSLLSIWGKKGDANPQINCDYGPSIRKSWPYGWNERPSIQGLQTGLVVPKSEALPKIDDKHALHVDEVHMKHTMPRLLTFSLNFNRKGNGTLERPPYAQVNPWDQQNLQGRSRHAFFSALWFWTGKLVDILEAWSLIRILRREPEIETKNKTSSQRSGPSSSYMHPPVAHDINFITCHVIADDKQGIATTNNI